MLCTRFKLGAPDPIVLLDTIVEVRKWLKNDKMHVISRQQKTIGVKIHVDPEI